MLNSNNKNVRPALDRAGDVRLPGLELCPQRLQSIVTVVAHERKQHRVGVLEVLELAWRMDNIRVDLSVAVAVDGDGVSQWMKKDFH